MAAISVTHPLLTASATGYAAGGRDSLVSGRYEPRHADAIVAAELQRALEDPDPYAGSRS